MTTWTQLYSDAESLRRKWFNATNNAGATTSQYATPTGARCAIISAVAAGGWKTNSDNPGGGSAFARTKLTNLTDGELFEVQVGSPRFSLDAGTSAGDSIITRLGSSTIVCRAARGTGTLFTDLGANPPIDAGGTPGLAANCVGDIKRDGGYGNRMGGLAVRHFLGGDAAGDLNDTYSVGLGGRGAQKGRFPAAVWGGGGIHRTSYDNTGTVRAFYPGAGRVCIEFFTKDPGF